MVYMIYTHTVQLPTQLAGALCYVRYLRVLRMLTQNVTKPHSLFTEFAATVHSRLMTPARTKLIRRCFYLELQANLREV